MESTTSNNKEAITILETLHGVIKSQQDMIKDLININNQTNMAFMPMMIGSINRQQPQIDPKHQQEFNDLFREKLFAQIKNDQRQAKE